VASRGSFTAFASSEDPDASSFIGGNGCAEDDNW
jgi:hypothetical protein